MAGQSRLEDLPATKQAPGAVRITAVWTMWNLFTSLSPNCPPEKDAFQVYHPPDSFAVCLLAIPDHSSSTWDTIGRETSACNGSTIKKTCQLKRVKKLQNPPDIMQTDHNHQSQKDGEAKTIYPTSHFWIYFSVYNNFN